MSVSFSEWPPSTVSRVSSGFTPGNTKLYTNTQRRGNITYTIYKSASLWGKPPLIQCPFVLRPAYKARALPQLSRGTCVRSNTGWGYGRQCQPECIAWCRGLACQQFSGRVSGICWETGGVAGGFDELILIPKKNWLAMLYCCLPAKDSATTYISEYQQCRECRETRQIIFACRPCQILFHELEVGRQDDPGIC